MGDIEHMQTDGEVGDDKILPQQIAPGLYYYTLGLNGLSTFFDNFFMSIRFFMGYKEEAFRTSEEMGISNVFDRC
jgi:hypothetical protein